jgi:hypothetical protein
LTSKLPSNIRKHTRRMWPLDEMGILADCHTPAATRSYLVRLLLQGIVVRGLHCHVLRATSASRSPTSLLKSHQSL